MTLINWPLMRHPLNWLTIWLMLFIAGIALHFVMVGMGKGSPPKKVQGLTKVKSATGRPPGFSEPAATSVGP